MKWYLDLDDTLYRTTFGYGELCRTAARLYDIKFMSIVLRLLRTRLRFDFGDGVRYSSRFLHMLRSYGIDSAQAEALLVKYLKGKDLLYPDAVVFLDWLEQKGIEPTILTFGDPETQELKLSLVPRISQFKIIVVQEPKQQYFKKLPRHDAILIDDRPVHDLPNWCTGVLLARKPVIEPYSGRIIKSLTELIE